MTADDTRPDGFPFYMAVVQLGDSIPSGHAEDTEEPDDRDLNRELV